VIDDEWCIIGLPRHPSDCRRHSPIGALVALRGRYFFGPFAIGAPLCAAYELAQQRRGANAAALAARESLRPR
jgi:hypothetical protein